MNYSKHLHKIDRQGLLKLSRFFSNIEGTILLYSGLESKYSSRSFLCLFPYEKIWVYPNKQWLEKGNKFVKFIAGENPWDGLKNIYSTDSAHYSIPEWVGFFGYEMGCFSDPEHLFFHEPSKTPEAYFQRSALVFSVDHQNDVVELLYQEEAEPYLDEEILKLAKKYSRIDAWIELLESVEQPIEKKNDDISFQLISCESRDSYYHKILKIKEYISAGDVYHVNLSQQFHFRGKKDPFQIFETLAFNHPTAYSAFIQFKDHSIISSSPEGFLRKKQETLETRPIKGTAPRGKNLAEDELNREKLENSEKDKAELLMIADLMRNDLGKISEAGSVNVSKIWECEAYTNVYHLVSTISSKPFRSLSGIDILRACFPGGSITGCPKLSAIETIAKLENRRRGIYTGAIGYFAYNGDFDFNIAIRTLTYRDGDVEVQLGGGIVIDSECETEYDETLHKGASIFDALGFTHDLLQR